MIRFSHFTSINQAITQVKKLSLGIKREDMPQIVSGKLDDFKLFLQDNGIKYHTENIYARNLKPTQKEFNTDKVENILNTPQPANKWHDENYPIIISSDNYVLDGHHRWLASYVMNDSVLSLKVDMDITNLLAKSHTYDSVKYKKVHEEKHG